MIPGNVRIFVCTHAVDMRKSFDALALTVRQTMGFDPMSGSLFVFANKRSNRLKILWWDRTGFAILYKRLHRATFRLPKIIEQGKSNINIFSLELAKILEGISLPQKKQHMSLNNTFSSCNLGSVC